MAGFELKLSGRDKFGGTTAIGIDDCFDLELFEIDDVYKDAKWSGERLKGVAQKLSARLRDFEKNLEDEVAAKVCKTDFEEWMRPMFEERLRNSKEYLALRKLVSMTETAIDCHGTILFHGD